VVVGVCVCEVVGGVMQRMLATSWCANIGIHAQVLCLVLLLPMSLSHTLVCCRVSQCVAECCSVLQYVAVVGACHIASTPQLSHLYVHCNTLQHTETRCNTLQ